MNGPHGNQPPLGPARSSDVFQARQNLLLASLPVPVSDASRELRALALLSGSLTDALTAKAAASVIEGQALAVLGATSAVVVTLGRLPTLVLAPASSSPSSSIPEPDGGAESETLALLHALGTPAHVSAALRRLEFDAPVPLAEVARTGEAVFLGTAAELRRYPEWCDAILDAGSCAAAAVPVWANGHLRGVLGLTWTTPHSFDEDERAFVLTLGVMCAQAIMRGHLKEAEQRAREAAEHANMAKTQFLRTMSHELRTPLTAVVGYTQLLADEVVGPMTVVQKDHLRRIQRSSNHLLGLIEELLHFAQLEAGESVVHARRLQAIDVVEETMELLRPLADQKGMVLRSSTSEESVEIESDHLKLRQILVNLAMNAIKYSDDGEVVVAVRRVRAAAGDSVVFEMTDTGRGISPADQEHVFEAFWQADQALTRSSHGTGLGLAVARQLARLLGGDVAIARSEPGRGSTFVATFPSRFPNDSPQ
jgi:signal transduction histidine kinase